MNILYATDGSEGALVGAQFLASVPLDADSQIRLLTVAPGDNPDAGERAWLGIEPVLGNSAAQITLDRRRGSTSGEVLEAILSASEEQPTDLVVVGTRGLSPVARFFLGSVAARVAHYTPCPVLIARPLHGKLDCVVLGVDGSAGSEQAVAWLRHFPLPRECEVRLVTLTHATNAFWHSLPLSLDQEIQGLVRHEQEQADERLKLLVAAFAADGRRAVAEVRSQETVSGLLEVAEEQNADLIVVGSQGLTRLEHFLLGSVSEKVLRHASCSVVVVRTCAGT